MIGLECKIAFAEERRGGERKRGPAPCHLEERRGVEKESLTRAERQGEAGYAGHEE